MSVKQAIDSGAFNDQEIDTSVVDATTVNATTVNATTVNSEIVNAEIVNATTLNTDFLVSNIESGLTINCPTGLQMNITGTTGGVGSVLTSSGTYANWSAIPYPPFPPFPSATVSNLSFQLGGNLLVFNKPDNMSTAMAMINITGSTTSIPNVYNVSAFQVNLLDSNSVVISIRIAPFNFVSQAVGNGCGAITVYIPANCVQINATILAENITSFFTYIDLVKCS
jgi:hypothetical protein